MIKEKKCLQFLGQHKGLSLTFQAEVLQPGRKSFAFCSPTACVGILQALRQKWTPYKEIACFSICR